MKALFLGGILHGQELDDPHADEYVYKETTLERQEFRGGWRPEQFEEHVYVRHPDKPAYRLKGYVPTQEDLELVEGCLPEE